MNKSYAHSKLYQDIDKEVTLPNDSDCDTIYRNLKHQKKPAFSMLSAITNKLYEAAPQKNREPWLSNNDHLETHAHLFTFSPPHMDIEPWLKFTLNITPHFPNFNHIEYELDNLMLTEGDLPEKLESGHAYTWYFKVENTEQEDVSIQILGESSDGVQLTKTFKLSIEDEVPSSWELSEKCEKQRRQALAHNKLILDTYQNLKDHNYTGLDIPLMVGECNDENLEIINTNPYPVLQLKL